MANIMFFVDQFYKMYRLHALKLPLIIKDGFIFLKNLNAASVVIQHMDVV